MLSPELKFKIVQNIVEPNVVSSLESFLKEAKVWKSRSAHCETLAQVLVGMAGILSFASISFNHHVLVFLAGSLSPISLFMSRFSTYSLKRSKEATVNYGKILNKYGLENLKEAEEQEYKSETPSLSINIP